MTKHVDLPALNSVSLTSNLSASMVRGKPLTTPLMLLCHHIGGRMALFQPRGTHVMIYVEDVAMRVMHEMR